MEVVESVSDLGLHLSEELLTVLVEPALLATKQYQAWNNTLKQYKTLKRNPRTFPRHTCSFLVCYTAVFCVVTQRSFPGGGALRDDTKNGCVAD